MKTNALIQALGRVESSAMALSAPETPLLHYASLINLLRYPRLPTHKILQ
jgi:hypothetical protein